MVGLGPLRRANTDGISRQTRWADLAASDEESEDEEYCCLPPRLALPIDRDVLSLADESYADPPLDSVENSRQGLWQRLESQELDKDQEPVDFGFLLGHAEGSGSATACSANPPGEEAEPNWEPNQSAPEFIPTLTTHCPLVGICVVAQDDALLSGEIWASFASIASVCASPTSAPMDVGVDAAPPALRIPDASPVCAGTPVSLAEALQLTSDSNLSALQTATPVSLADALQRDAAEHGRSVEAKSRRGRVDSLPTPLRNSDAATPSASGPTPVSLAGALLQSVGVSSPRVQEQGGRSGGSQVFSQEMSVSSASRPVRTPQKKDVDRQKDTTGKKRRPGALTIPQRQKRTKSEERGVRTAYRAPLMAMPTAGVEVWEHRLDMRRRCIELGKATPEYSAYEALKQREEREPGEPMTPDPDDKNISKRRFKYDVQQWRLALKQRYFSEGGEQASCASTDEWPSVVSTLTEADGSATNISMDGDMDDDSFRLERTF